MNKNLIAITAIFFVALGATASADDAHHPEQQGAAEETAPANQRERSSESEIQNKAADRPESAPQANGMGMMANMYEMREQMQRLMRVEDAQERQHLIEQHMQLMERHMGMVSAMMRSEGMGGGSMPMEMCRRMMDHQE